MGKLFGYCHYCGKRTAPPTIYIDESGNEFTWNNCSRQFEKGIIVSNERPQITTVIHTDAVQKKFIPESEIWNHYHKTPENNLLRYLRGRYGNEKVDSAKEMYVLGTYPNGGTMFWLINKELKVQKLKVAYYNNLGKRTKHYTVPYQNKDGYYSCLFGEHLLIDSCNKEQIVVLVESEKTAVVGSILIPKYTWLAYSGANGLTQEKAKALKGFKKVLAIPDFSNDALKAIKKRAESLKTQEIDVRILDLTNGMSDKEMDELGIYNKDLEDVFRDLESSLYKNLIQQN